MRPFARRLLGETLAQDMVEYALLVALVGLVGMAAWSALETRLGQAYTNYDTRTQNLWRPPDPATP
jgi:Flp pilus assembly pilin Flp